MSVAAIDDSHRLRAFLKRGFKPLEVWADWENRSWGVVQSDEFASSMAKMLITFPDLKRKLKKFLDAKIDDPVNNKYGKHDRRMVGDLAGFYHCHLRDDAVLIYGLSKRVITLICVTPHAEIEGRRLRLTARRLSQFAA